MPFHQHVIARTRIFTSPPITGYAIIETIVIDCLTIISEVAAEKVIV
jgi:hypothetical protein